MVASLTTLPPELQEHICSFLDPVDLERLSLTNRAFFELVSSTTLWEKTISRHFQLSPDAYSSTPSSPTCPPSRNFYRRILKDNASFLGLWLMKFKYYGGLLRVFVEDSCIFGEEIFSPVWNSELLNDVTRDRVFKLHYTMDEELEEAIVSNDCLLWGKEGESSNHQFLIYHKSPYPSGRDRLSIQCLGRDQHPPIDTSDFSQAEAIAWTRGYKRWLANSFSCDCDRILHPEAPHSDVPLKPGFFKGSYGSHGTELILVRYKDVHHIEGFKLTGDPNVPVSKITFNAYLTEVMFPSLEEQMDMDALRQVRPINILETSVPSPPYKVIIPEDYVEFRAISWEKIPKFCKGRYRGSCQIAGHGYRNPQFADAHFIIFNQSLLGLLIFDLSVMMVLHRFSVER